MRDLTPGLRSPKALYHALSLKEYRNVLRICVNLPGLRSTVYVPMTDLAFLA